MTAPICPDEMSEALLSVPTHTHVQGARPIVSFASQSPEAITPISVTDRCTLTNKDLVSHNALWYASLDRIAVLCADAVWQVTHLRDGFQDLMFERTK